jgi:uncharacterized membrane protein YuzA (DUF378 family)
MKVLRRNPAGILAVTLVSAGTLGLGLLGPAGFDLIKDPFEVLLVFNRVLSSIVVMGILYRLTRTSPSPQPVLVPVRV